MNTTVEKARFRPAALLWFSVGAAWAFYLFVSAVESNSLAYAASGCGLLVLGVVWYRYPISFTTPVLGTPRTGKTKIDAKTAIATWVGLGLVIVGILLHWVYDL